MGERKPKSPKHFTTQGMTSEFAPSSKGHDEPFLLKAGCLIGRYQVKSLLGSGGFGAVYRALDFQLHREVAIKVPLPKYTDSAESVARYLHEARLIAKLDHPNIVPVFDSGRDPQVECFFVTKLVDGNTLSRILAKRRPDFLWSARICRDLAYALHYAHRRGVVHRDVKPGNIILDGDDRPYLLDFGLAMDDACYGTGSGYLGTPEYMSPEQARGEGHLVDGRSDVYSLGVVLYRMISGSMPSVGSTREELLQSVAYHDSRPPRQLDDSIPRELERLCLRAIAKRVSDRYTTAKDFADELAAFVVEQGQAHLSHSSTSPSPADANTARPAEEDDLSARRSLVVPKGLRAFDEADADFFLSLLPGPVDRRGVPERIRFLTKLVEESRINRVQAVGLIYGPSGCGKSSLIRAGLIPRLSERICPVFIEASSDTTESRMLQALRKLDPNLRKARSLAEIGAKVRLGQTQLQGRKVVVFLDQFEQWLNKRSEYRHCELVAALRQCDGVNLQCILSVRDDFWVSVSRMLREVEVEVREGQNAALIDLFDMTHARSVLAAIGRAHGRLPRVGGELSRQQSAFLDRAIDELSERRRIFPVRLAVFAEMMKDKPWDLKNLEYAGGGQGIGVAFLNETFNVPEAPMRQKRHAAGAQRILAKLIPPSNDDLKGSQCTVAELRLAADYTDAREFDDLIQLLDQELRLLTPVADLSGADSRSGVEAPAGEPAYQLTHDYLVAPLKTWLAQRRRETLAGRAHLRLEETAGYWSRHRDRKLLPTWWEWAFIRFLVPAKRWTETQRAMMTAAGRILGRQAILLAAVGCVLTLAVGYQMRRMDRELAHKRLLASPLAAVPESIEGLQAQGRAALARIDETIANTETTGRAAGSQTKPLSQEQFRLRLAAAAIDHRRDPLLEAASIRGDPERVKVIRDVLTHADPDRDGFFWSVIEAADSAEAERLRAACFLASRAASDPRWEAMAPMIAAPLAREPFTKGEQWAELLMPVSTEMLPAVSELLVSRPTASERPRLIMLARLFSDGDARRFATLTQLARNLGDAPDRHSIRRSTLAAAAIAELGDWQIAIDGLERDPVPTFRTQLIDALENADIEPREFFEILAQQAAPSAADGVRSGILTSLGGLEIPQWSPEDQQRLRLTIEQTLADPEATGESKSVCHWLAARSKKTNAGDSPAQRMVLLAMPDGSDESGEGSAWRFKISACPTTVQGFLRFRPDHAYDQQTAATTTCPVNEVTWYDAVAYCNWLSEQAGLEREQWCYLPNADGNYERGMAIPADVHQRRGYRLPTTREWNHASQAGTETKWSWGAASSMADRYAWSLNNSGFRSHAVAELRPNPFGLFDMHGNVWEWLHDTPKPSGTSRVGNEPRFLRGGAYLSDIDSIGWEATIANAPDHKTGADGFRVVRRVFD